jgi:lysophospholipase L1-like esterase
LANNPVGSTSLSLFTFAYNNSGNGNQGTLELNTDALKIQIASAQGDNSSSRIYVDDVEVQPGILSQPTAGNADSYITLVFVGERKIRNIKVLNVSNFRSVRVAPNSSLYSVKPAPLRAIAIGDSVFSGAGTQANVLRNWPTNIMNELGYKYGPANLSVGGTSLENAGQPYNFIGRLTGGSVLAPLNNTILSANVNAIDIVFLECSINDSPLSTTLTQSYVTLLQLIRSLQPNALIVMCPPYFLQVTTNSDTLEQLAFNGFKQFNDPKTIFIAGRQLCASGPWLTGAGYCKSGNVGSTGSSSYYVGADGTHPTDEGNNFLAKQVVRELYRQLGI